MRETIPPQAEDSSVVRFVRGWPCTCPRYGCIIGISERYTLVVARNFSRHANSGAHKGTPLQMQQKHANPGAHKGRSTKYNKSQGDRTNPS